MARKTPLWLIALSIAAAPTVYALITIAFETRQPIIAFGQDSMSTVVRPSPHKIRAGALWPQLRSYLKALGDRLEQSGKERLVLTGTLDLVGSDRIAVTAILEFPDRLQLTTHSGSQPHTTTYDGQSVPAVGTQLNNADQDLIESLVNDSADHFFKAQVQSAPTRHLGDRFRTDDGSTENYAGPYYDVFSMEDRLVLGSASRSQTKFYYFNSVTRLLERVTYQIVRNGDSIEIETQFSNWKKTEDQQVAHRIVRLENGQPVISLTITSAAVAARINDGRF
jgi:hypothetical protein